MQNLDNELHRFGNWTVALGAIQSWRLALQHRRSIRHPLLPRMNAIEALLQTIQVVSSDNPIQAHQYVQAAVRAGQRWLREAQRGSSHWYLPTDNDAGDLLAGFWNTFELVAEELAAWEARFSTARSVGIEQGKYSQLEGMEELLTRGRAMRAGVEALIACTHSSSLIAHAWITLSQHRIAVLYHEVEAWRAFADLLESRGNRQ
jgi:hypothetical protein